MSYRGKSKSSYGNHRSGRTVAGVQNNRSFRAKITDAGLKAPIAKSIVQWMDAPNRFDLPEVDDQKESLSAKQIEELKDAIKDEKAAGPDYRKQAEALEKAGFEAEAKKLEAIAKQEDSHKEILKAIVESKPEPSIKVKPSVEGSSATYNKATGWMAISFSSIPAPELRQEMKANGFRYNPVRKQWVAKWYPYREELAKKYAGDIEQVDIKPNWAAKAEHAASMAEKHIEKSEDIHDRAHKLSDAIPFGQPILVGHHSERHHRSDINKIDSWHRKGVEEYEIAQKYADRAERYGKKATGESPGLIYRRIQKLEADKRKMERNKAEAVAKKSQKSIEWADKWLNEYNNRLAVEREKYKASGGISIENTQFKPGDKIVTRFGIGELKSLSKKTARVRLFSPTGIYTNRRNESLLSVDDLRSKVPEDKLDEVNRLAKEQGYI